MEALYRNPAVHSIADFVVDTNARLSLLRVFYFTEEQKQQANLQANGLLSDATTAVNGLLASFARPVSVWHRSPQLNALVRLTLHEWQGFSPKNPNKVVLHATCHNPVEGTTTLGHFGVEITHFAQLLRTQHPLRPAAPVYYSHEQTAPILDITNATTLDMRRSGAVPTWRP